MALLLLLFTGTSTNDFLVVSKKVPPGGNDSAIAVVDVASRELPGSVVDWLSSKWRDEAL